MRKDGHDDLDDEERHDEPERDPQTMFAVAPAQMLMAVARAHDSESTTPAGRAQAHVASP